MTETVATAEPAPEPARPTVRQLAEALRNKRRPNESKRGLLERLDADLTKIYEILVGLDGAQMRNSGQLAVMGRNVDSTAQMLMAHLDAQHNMTDADMKAAYDAWAAKKQAEAAAEQAEQPKEAEVPNEAGTGS